MSDINPSNPKEEDVVINSDAIDDINPFVYNNGDWLSLESIDFDQMDEASWDELLAFLEGVYGSPKAEGLEKSGFQQPVSLSFGHHVPQKSSKSLSKHKIQYLSDCLEIFIYDYQKSPVPKTLNKIKFILDKLTTYAKKNPGSLYVSDMDSKDDSKVMQDYNSLGLLLEIVSLSMPKEEARLLLKRYAMDLMNYNDPGKAYLQLKELSHVLPYEGNITIDLGGNIGLRQIDAESHRGVFTAQQALKSIKKYCVNLESDSLKWKVFSEIESILTEHMEFSLRETINNIYFQRAYDAFQAGFTVLLPSGWDNHFVSVILDKANNYLGMCNTGDSHDLMFSGTKFYKITNGNALSPELISKIITNEDMDFLEKELPQILGLVEDKYLVEPMQLSGNCAWQSVETAIEALLYLKLLPYHSSDVATKLAHNWYNEWDAFQTNMITQDYFEDNPIIVDATVVAKMLIDNHPTLFYHTEISEKSISGASIILANLLDAKHSPYLETALDKLNQHEPKPILKILLEEYSCFNDLFVQREISPKELLAEVENCAEILLHKYPHFFNSAPVLSAELEIANTLVKALSSSKYYEQFADMAHYFKHAKPELVEIFKQHGLSISVDSSLANIQEVVTLTTPVIGANDNVIDKKSVLTPEENILDLLGPHSAEAQLPPTMGYTNLSVDDLSEMFFTPEIS